MSIEKKIDELIAALNANTAAMASGSAVKTLPPKQAAEAAQREKPAATTPAASEKKADAPAVTYLEVAGPFQTLASKNREVAVGICKQHGASSLKELKEKPELFATILAAVKKALADLEAAA